MTVEVPAVLPFSPAASRSLWSLQEPIGVFVPIWNAQTMQRVRYGTARWSCELTFENMGADERHNLAAFVARVGRHRAFWLHDPSHNRRGSFPSSELLSGGRAAAFWSGTNRAFSVTPDGIRVTRSGASMGVNIASAAGVTVVANAVYALRASWEGVRLSANTFGLRAGSTAGAADYGSTTATATEGRHVATCLPTGTTLYPGWSDSLSEAANWPGNAVYDVRDPSLVRAFRVDGGSSPTDQGPGVSAIYVKDLVTSTADQLVAGDMVEILGAYSGADRSHMVRLTHPLDGDSSGKGRMLFEPPLRYPVSNNALVIPHQPRVRMILAEDPQIDTRPGWYSDVTLKCEEVFE